jgi:hypothetical protein
MQETDEDKEGKLPRQEIWQREDEESLTPIDIEVEEGQELDTNQEASAGYVMEETDVHPDSGDLDEESTDEMISIGTTLMGGDESDRRITPTRRCWRF